MEPPLQLSFAPQPAAKQPCSLFWATIVGFVYCIIFPFAFKVRVTLVCIKRGTHAVFMPPGRSKNLYFVYFTLIDLSPDDGACFPAAAEQKPLIPEFLPNIHQKMTFESFFCHHYKQRPDIVK
jgi:hypothetical protein